MYHAHFPELMVLVTGSSMGISFPVSTCLLVNALEVCLHPRSSANLKSMYIPN
jgi:hypothetical protein